MYSSTPLARQAYYVKRRAALIVVTVVALSVIAGVIGWVLRPVGRGVNASAVYPTPTPAFAARGPLAQVVAPAIWATGVISVDTTYDQTTRDATVTVTLKGTVPNTDAKTAAAQELAKGLCFMAEQALWTSGTGLHQVKVIVQGPFQDEYGGVITDAYAVAVVTARTGNALDWTTATADSAWLTYDSAFLRESFVLVD